MKFHKPTHGPPGVEKAFMQNKCKEFMELTGMEVEYMTPEWQSWYTRLLELNKSNEQLDLLYLPGGWIPELAEKGRLVNLSEEAGATRMIDHWKANEVESIFKLGSYHDRQFGIPVYGAVWCFMYNKRLFAESGCSKPPQTWGELEICAQKIKDRFPDICPYGINDDSDGHFVDHGFIYLMAGRLVNWSDEENQLTFNNSWSLKGLAFLQSLVKKELANKPVNAPSNLLFNDFLDEKIAMIVGPSDVVLMHRERNSPFPLGVAMMPHPDGGEPISYSSVGFYSIAATSNNIKESLKLLEYLTNPQLLQTHIERIGMLPINQGISCDEKDEQLSTFYKQVKLSGTFPTIDLETQEKLIQEMLSCLRLEKSPESALSEVSKNE